MINYTNDKNLEILLNNTKELEKMKNMMYNKIYQLYELISLEKDMFYYNHIPEYFHTINTLKDILNL